MPDATFRSFAFLQDFVRKQTRNENHCKFFVRSQKIRKIGDPVSSEKVSNQADVQLFSGALLVNIISLCTAGKLICVLLNEWFNFQHRLLYSSNGLPVSVCDFILFTEISWIKIFPFRRINVLSKLTTKVPIDKPLRKVASSTIIGRLFRLSQQDGFFFSLIPGFLRSTKKRNVRAAEYLAC